MARDGVTDLFISSGDGTIQEILTQIVERGPFTALPRICLLPHGTTNLSANDLGFESHSLDAQAAFLRSLEARSLVTRNTIRCANPGDGRARHGMFVGTGAVAVATHYCQRAFNEQGVKGQWAVAKTLLTAVRKYMFSRPDAQDEARFDRSYAISVRRRWPCHGGRHAASPHVDHARHAAAQLPSVLGRQDGADPHHGHSLPRAVGAALDAAHHVWRRKPRRTRGRGELLFVGAGGLIRRHVRDRR